MKKKLKLLIVLLSFILFTLNVKAATGISCPSAATVGEVFSCTVTVDDGDTATITYDGLKLYKGSASMTSSGTVQFKALESGSYDVTVSGTSGTDTKTINVKTATTTTNTTTTKTTTATKSSNTNLEKILINGKTIDNFDKDTKSYNVKVDYDVKKATVKAVAEDDNATVKVEGDSKLVVGDNEFTISVTSEDNTTKNYKVIITREDEEKSNSTKLKNIKVDGYKLDFDKKSKTFYLKIDSEDTELDIIVTPADKDATVKIDGNEDLEDGSIIKIIVTSADEENKSVYKIIIEKKDTNPVPFIIVGIIVLILVGVGIFIFLQNKKKEKEEKKKIKRNKKRFSEYADDDYDELKNDNDDLDDDNDENEETRKMPIIDNDEQEKTRMFSYEKYDDFDDLEKTKVMKFSYDEDDE